MGCRVQPASGGFVRIARRPGGFQRRRGEVVSNRHRSPVTVTLSPRHPVTVTRHPSPVTGRPSAHRPPRTTVTASPVTRHPARHAVRPWRDGGATSAPSGSRVRSSGGRANAPVTLLRHTRVEDLRPRRAFSPRQRCWRLGPQPLEPSRTGRTAGSSSAPRRRGPERVSPVVQQGAPAVVHVSAAQPFVPSPPRTSAARSRRWDPAPAPTSRTPRSPAPRSQTPSRRRCLLGAVWLRA